MPAQPSDPAETFDYVTHTCGHVVKRLLGHDAATIARIAARPCRDCQRRATRARMDAAERRNAEAVAAPGDVLIASSGIIHAKRYGLEPAQTLCGLPATSKTWTLANARPITCKQCRARKGARQ